MAVSLRAITAAPVFAGRLQHRRQRGDRQDRCAVTSKADFSPGVTAVHVSFTVFSTSTASVFLSVSPAGVH